CSVLFYVLSLHDALPICRRKAVSVVFVAEITPPEISPESSVCLDVDPAHQLVIGEASVLSSHLVVGGEPYNRMVVTVFVDSLHRSEEHTSELQSRFDLVC